MVFIALVYLIDMGRRKDFLFGRLFHFFLMLFLTVFLFFLSSKLVIIYFFLYSIFELARSFKRISKSIAFFSGLALAVLLVFILIVPNPIGNRFEEIIQTNFDFLKKEKYDPGEYFNGLQFRMLQWRFVPQILNERKAWLTGVSIGDAQACLNQKYVSVDMYVGTPARGDKGFIGYNTHNEFLEALLQTGIPGLLLFILITATFIKMMVEKRNSAFSFVTLLLIIYSFTESVLETQYSLFMYLFFPLFFYVDNKD
jgi:O-antigen ligase